MSDPIAPGQVKVYGRFSKHLGPRFIGAGLGLVFHYNQVPGIHFKVAATQEYQGAILKGINDGMASRFPGFPETGSIWIIEVSEHEVDSSPWAFYLAARCAIEQAYALTQVKHEEFAGSTTRSEGAR